MKKKPAVPSTKSVKSNLVVENVFKQTFHAAVQNATQRALPAGECQTAERTWCTLCYASKIEYAQEYKFKNAALQKFWHSLGAAIALQPLVASPHTRYYRTVSKRKAFLNGNIFSLGLIGVDLSSARNFPIAVQTCAIEPELHSTVYAAVHSFLDEREHRELAHDFNYVIVRGDSPRRTECTVIFNIKELTSENRREVNMLSKHLTKKVPVVSGVFVAVDSHRSHYYLQSASRKKEQGNKIVFQKIFGEQTMFHSVGNKKFGYSPLSFSQTNHSILEKFISTLSELLALQPDDTVCDLYCGYGLFALSFASHVRQVLGIELSQDSIRDAIENTRRLQQRNCKFIANTITDETLLAMFHTFKPTKLLLDPPRTGTQPGVIEFLAATQPKRIVHIFCNIDILHKELDRWKKNGYELTDAVPFDMFPGTDEVEIMVGLERK